MRSEMASPNSNHFRDGTGGDDFSCDK